MSKEERIQQILDMVHCNLYSKAYHYEHERIMEKLIELVVLDNNKVFEDE